MVPELSHISSRRNKRTPASSLARVLGGGTIAELAARANADKGDAVLIVAGRRSVVAASLGALRLEVAKRENLIPADVFKPLMVTDFPMFEYNDAEHHYDAAHHPFTSPMDEDLEQFRQAVETGERELLGGVRAKAYDACHKWHRGGGRLDPYPSA